MAILGKYSSYVYAIVRIVAGFCFMLHGTQKFFGFPPSNRPGGGSDWLSTLGAGIELIGGLMIMIGLFAGIAAFICSGMMAVAYFGWHQPNGPLPIQNGGELAVLYCFIFLLISAWGSGVWSVDSLRRPSASTPADT